MQQQEFSSHPQVKEYLDYRKFLRDFFDFKKNTLSSYSHRTFLRRADITSPSHLKLVIDGKRNLTYRTIEKYQAAIGFPKKQEANFFKLLVQYNQETNVDKKVDKFNEIIKQKKKSGISLLEEEQFNFLSKWHYVAIYVLVDLKDFVNTPDWIAGRLRKKVSKDNIERAINDLIRLGLLEYDSDRGLRQSKGALDTPEEISSMAVVHYHRNMINLSLQYLEEGDWRKREFNGGTIPMNNQTIKLLKEKLKELRKDINIMTDEIENPEEIYQFNIQLFPLTENVQ
jgi:uncharacterized protein (TIGR02147 family)